MIDKTETIFVVDDNASNLMKCSEILSEKYNVYTFNSGARLFKILDKLVPNLILLDIEMPEMDGYEVIRLLKENPQTDKIPVIFLTGSESVEVEIKGLSCGAIDFIRKPFYAPLLLKRLEAHLSVASQREKLINQLVDRNYSLGVSLEEKNKEKDSIKNAFIKTIADLVEHRDSITGEHIERTQKYIEIIVDGMKEHNIYSDKISTMDKNLLIQTSALHDIGKIGIKDSILSKPGPLTNEEYDEIKKHSLIGEKIISQIQERTTVSDFLTYAKVFAVSHHEKWDGSGYPHGLKGEDIPLLGRIMAIADVYDALTHDRSYKLAISHNKSVEIIENGSGTHFDPALVDLFLRVHGKFEKFKDKMNRPKQGAC